jgi:hypothetical protein
MLTNTGAESNSSVGSYSDYIPIAANTPYYFSHIAGIGAFYSMCVYDSSKTFLENVNIQGTGNASGTVTFTQGAYIRVNVYRARLDECQIELGSTATEYEPYQGQTHTATFPDTVYGGNYDFVSGDGFETISDKVDLGSLTWRKATGYFYSLISSLTPPKRPNTDNVPFVGNCESYKVSYLNDTADGIITMNRTGNAQIYIRDNERSEYTEEEFKEFLSGKYWCYELATPTTIETSAEEITLLKGNNVLSTNADDMELKYSVSLDSLLPTTTRTLAKSPIVEEPIVEEPKEETDETEEQR